MSNAETNSNNLLTACLVLLIILVIAILVVGIIYIAKTAHFNIKRRRNVRSSIFKDRKKRVINVDEVAMFITSFATALSRLSSNKIGALIVFENRDSLEKYVQLGNKVDSPFFAEFVYSIYYNHESSLHDGAMILRNLRITSLSSYLPVSKRLLPVKYGARHRAAFGIAERTDALAFVVSETTGNISFMHESHYATLPTESVALANEITSILFDYYYPLISARTPMVVQKIKQRLN